MIEYEDVLNNQQLEAVRHFEGPLLVLAGAGSGKTRVITYRIAYLIDMYGVEPDSILAMTFTNKAAQEMKERINSLLRGGTGVFISTFHSACAYFLRRYAYLLGYDNRYIIYDENDSRQIIKQTLRDLGQEDSVDNISRFHNEICRAKDRGVDTLSLYDSSIENRVMIEYQKSLLRSNAMDFSDLLLNMVRILREFGEIRDLLSERYRFLLVDEFQDTNRIQMELLLLLLKKHNNICVVGDDDQSIYRWRGATVENILGFDSYFNEAKVVRLEQNYRSSGSIIMVASELIKNNRNRHQKTLFTRRPMGENITFYTARNDIEEASFIAEEIIRHYQSKGRSPRDFAILVRTNAQMRILEEQLRIRNIPYEVIGGMKFYERKEIKDIIGYLRIIANPASDLDFERILNVPPRGFGDATLIRLKEIANKRSISLFEAALEFSKTADFARYLSSLRGEMEGMSVYDITCRLIADIKYREYLIQYYKRDYNDRIANIDELLNSMIRRENGNLLTLSRFLEGIALMSDIDAADMSSQTVSLMTMHSAKGLEFPVVFISGFEENIIPHFRSLLDPDGIDEERRLLYVAITRAKERLYILWAKERFQAGMPSRRMVSRFFDELPKNLFTFLPVRETDQRLISGLLKDEGDRSYRVEYYPEFLKPGEEDVPVYKIGMRVVHSKFGVGIIKQIDSSGEETKLTILFERYGYKRLLSSFVKIL